MSLEPLPAIVTAGKANTAQGAVGIIIMSISLIVQLWGLFEKFPKMRLSKDRGDRAVLLLIGLTMFSMSFYAVELYMYSRSWLDEPTRCHGMGAAIVVTYITSKQFLYCFLYERAAIVLDALNLTKGIFAIYRHVTLLIIVFGIPAGFWWTLFKVFYGIVFVPEGMCVLSSISTAPIISFAALDLFLSLLVLFLFVYPLRLHIMKVRNKIINSSGDAVMGKVLRKNMGLSLLIIFVTVANLSIMTTLMTLFGEGTDRSGLHWLIYATFFPSWDLIICLFAALAMTKVWMPKKLAAYFETVASEDNLTKEGSKTTSKNAQSYEGNLVGRKTGVQESSKVGTVVVMSDIVTATASENVTASEKAITPENAV